MLGGCGGDGTPTPGKPTVATPATRPAPEKPPIILPESRSWTREEALAALPDEKRRVSAALRLVRLANVETPALPDPLPRDLAARLRFIAVSEDWLALGLEDASNPAHLEAPILISRDGDVRLTPGVSELRLAEDLRLFPHLLIGPQRVFNAAFPEQPLLALKSPEKAAFALGSEPPRRYVAVVLQIDGQPVEVGKYGWDAIEGSFFGPAMDTLPDPPGGTFAINLPESHGLQPVGGILPTTLPSVQKREVISGDGIEY
ncbi:MAG: hypothetical protein U1D55_18240 [Phycisphaerae bacterium]